MPTLSRAAAALLLTLLLAACGGGDHEEDTARSTDPVYCEQSPGRCS